jgi:hypothetical protein
MEAVFVLAMVAQRFDVNLVAGQHIDMRNLGTLRPTPGVNVVLTPLGMSELSQSLSLAKTVAGA